jgi:hypothetical protein
MRIELSKNPKADPRYPNQIERPANHERDIESFQGKRINLRIAGMPCRVESSLSLKMDRWWG